MQPLRNEFVTLDIQLQQLLRGLESMMLPTVNIDKALADALDLNDDEHADKVESDSKDIKEEEDFYTAFYPHLIQYRDGTQEGQEVFFAHGISLSLLLARTPARLLARAHSPFLLILQFLPSFLLPPPQYPLHPLWLLTSFLFLPPFLPPPSLLRPFSPTLSLFNASVQQKY